MMETYSDMSKKQMNLNTHENVLKLPHLASLVLLAFVLAVLHLTRDTGVEVAHLDLDPVSPRQEPIGIGDNGLGGCDLFSGRWVYDVSYPRYKDDQCPFMGFDFACEIYGRKNLKYQNWRWQPHQCDLPRFNGEALLEKIRGKKLIFVGDSLIRNQWKSMLCLIHPYFPSTSKTPNEEGNLLYFHQDEYDVTIGFYWSPMLVESNGDGMKAHTSTSRVVNINSIEKHGRHWADADILVFDSYAWWMGRRPLTILWGSFGSPDAIEQPVLEQSLRPFEIAMNTWSDWLEMNINRTRTKLFFMSPSPYRPGDTVWGTNHSCYKETKPVSNATYWASAENHEMMRIAKSTIDKLEQRGVKVEYVNITELSAYREDAHPATNRVFWRSLSKRDSKNLTGYSDCLHWCLPGVPDVWNQIIYTYIMRA